MSYTRNNNFAQFFRCWMCMPRWVNDFNFRVLRTIVPNYLYWSTKITQNHPMLHLVSFNDDFRWPFLISESIKWLCLPNVVNIFNGLEMFYFIWNCIITLDHVTLLKSIFEILFANKQFGVNCQNSYVVVVESMPLKLFILKSGLQVQMKYLPRQTFL